MSLGQWLKSLTTIDHIILIILYGCCIYLSKGTLETLIEMYDKKKQYNDFRIQLRITPIILLSLALLYSILLYKILDAIFGIMP